MEQTNPQAGVAPPSIEDRMSSFIAQSEADPEQKEPGQEPAQEVQPEGQAETEVSDSPASEAEAEEAQPAVDAFEIVHNGQQIKLTLEEAIQHAQQGYDYTQKTQALAEKSREADERLQRLALVEQMQPHLQVHLAQVKALESQMQPYQNVDWVALAQDPQLYAQHQAHFMTLQRAYNGAVQQLQQTQGQVQQHLGAIQQQRLAQEAANLPNVIPEWKDPAKQEAGKADLLKYFTSQGISAQEANAELNTAMKVAVAWKAMQWDRLQKSKSDTSKTLRKAPPVTVPGAAQSSTAKADKDKQLQARLKKTGSREDAMAVLLNRM